MVDKERFIRIVEALKQQTNLNKEFSENMGKCFPEVYSYPLYPKNHLMGFIINEYDKDGWLEWFVFELNFGEKVGKVTINGENVEITTAEQLYDLVWDTK